MLSRWNHGQDLRGDPGPPPQCQVIHTFSAPDFTPPPGLLPLLLRHSLCHAFVCVFCLQITPTDGEAGSAALLLLLIFMLPSQGLVRPRMPHEACPTFASLPCKQMIIRHAEARIDALMLAHPHATFPGLCQDSVWQTSQAYLKQRHDDQCSCSAHALLPGRPICLLSPPQLTTYLIE